VTKAPPADACPKLHSKLGGIESFSRRVTRSCDPTPNTGTGTHILLHCPSNCPSPSINLSLCVSLSAPGPMMTSKPVTARRTLARRVRCGGQAARAAGPARGVGCGLESRSGTLLEAGVWGVGIAAPPLLLHRVSPDVLERGERGKGGGAERE
jgi:hypothetical protein